MYMSEIIGHRGCAGHAPENTLAGLRDAARMGVKWVEADATLLADESVVLFHDDTLDRCTDRTGFIREQKWPDVLQIDAGLWFDEGQYIGERIPLLHDALKCIQSLGLGFNLELKTHRGEGERLADRVAEILREFRPENILVSSFDQTALQRFHHHGLNLPLGVIFDDLPNDWFTWTKECQAVSVHLWERHITPDKVLEVKAKGLEVYAFTINSKVNAKRMWAMGVDGVFSDYPNTLDILD